MAIRIRQNSGYKLGQTRSKVWVKNNSRSRMV
jgi:hypothetical protein